MTEEAREEAKSLSARWRASLSVILVASAAGSIVYQLLSYGDLKRGWALFVGLPLLLGLLVANLTRSRSIYGEILRADIVFLCIVAPLLGEGAICLIMGAPLFVGVSMIAAVAIHFSRRNRSRAMGLALLPILFGVLEQRVDALHPVAQTVVSRTDVVGTVDAWREIVRGVVPLQRIESHFLRAGFPLPAAVREEENRIHVDFQFGGVANGTWSSERQRTERGARYVMVSDTSKISSWMEVLEATVEVEASSMGTVLVQTTRFRPRLSPLFYFLPLQRVALEEAHELVRHSWRRAMGN